MKRLSRYLLISWVNLLRQPPSPKVKCGAFDDASGILSIYLPVHRSEIISLRYISLIIFNQD